MSLADFTLYRDYKARAFNIIYNNTAVCRSKENKTNLESSNVVKLLKLRQNTRKIETEDSISSHLRKIAIEILDS